MASRPSVRGSRCGAAASPYPSWANHLALGAFGIAIGWASEPLTRGAFALLGLALVGLHYLTTAARPPVLHYQPTPLTRRVLAACPLLQRRFYPTPWGFNRHIQLGLHASRDARAAELRFDRIDHLVLADGGTVSLEWAGLQDRWPADQTPTLVVLPTLCGDGRSLRRFVRTMRAQLGWRVVVCNPRGHGNLTLTTPRVSILGSTDDLRAQVSQIRQHVPHSRLYAVGLSAGSALLVRYLGEEGVRTPITAAVALCPGYDATKAFARVSPAYDRLLTRLAKAYYLSRHHEALRDAPGYWTTLASRSLADFHARSFGLAGYPSMAGYQRSSEPTLVARDIRVPLLIVNAADDPVCVQQNVHDNLDLVRAMPDTILAVTARGSHCAFLEGTIRPASWADRLIAQYFSAINRINDVREPSLFGG